MQTLTSSARHNDIVSSCSTSNVQEKTQEDYSNKIRALNVDSLKVDSVVIQNPCSEIENSNSETASSKSIKESSLNSTIKDVHAIKYKMSKEKERCMTYFRSLHSHLQVLSKEDLKERSGIESEVQDDNSRSGNDTDADDAYIRPIYDKEPMAKIQEKVFAIAALKNDLRKLKGNSVDTKFASQVDVNHNVSKPVTQDYLPKKSESAFAKPNHMIASSSFRNSFKNILQFSSNDMVHNHYLDKAKKKTQERDRNSKPSVMTPARFQSATTDSKPKPRSTNHSSRSLPVSKSSCVTMPAMPKADH
nr:hypothetical protein [Tanacetum cinerariifolium]